MKFLSKNILQDSDLLKEIFLSLSKYSENEIILTDEKFNLIFHNTKHSIKNKKNLNDFINDFLNINIKKHLDNFKISDKKHLLIKMIYTQQDYNQKIPINLHICKILNSHKIIKAYIIILQDITQEIKNHIQKETFIDIISHDLKNPIRANIQILELILKEKFGKLENSLKMILDELLNSCSFINYMTDNLLIKYKNELNLYELKKEKYSIVKLVKDKCNDLMSLLDRKHQTIEFTVEGNIKDIIIDKNEIGKVINNLIINASEQSSENSKIKIYISNSKRSINVSFIDFGKHKPQEKLHEIFDEFLTCSNKFRKVGFSLELYNCKKIIEAHNGVITAENVADRGTSITFSLLVP